MRMRIGVMAIGLATALMGHGASDAAAAAAVGTSPGFVQVCDNALIDVADMQAGIIMACVSYKTDGTTISFVPSEPEMSGESHKGWLIKHYDGEVSPVTPGRIYVEARLTVEGRDALGPSSKLILIRFVATAAGNREKLP